MPIEMTMPALSPTMEEGTLAKWMVKEGDTVSAGDIIAEIETDKATMEVEAVDEGTVGKLVVAEGTEGVKVNAVIAVLLEEGEDAGDIQAPKADGGAKKPPKAEGRQPGARPRPRPRSRRRDMAGARRRRRRSRPQPAGGNGKAARRAARPPARNEGERIFASPLARRIAKEKGIDLGQVNGSGPKGRIVKADIEGFEPSKAALPAGRCSWRRARRGAGRRGDARLGLHDRPGAQDVRGARLQRGHAGRHAQDHRDPADPGQADDPAFLPAPRHPARHAAGRCARR